MKSFKRKEIFPFATTWMTLRALCKVICQNEKKLYYIFHLYMKSKKKIIIIDTENRLVVSRGRGRRVGKN